MPRNDSAANLYRHEEGVGTSEVLQNPVVDVSMSRFGPFVAVRFDIVGPMRCDSFTKPKFMTLGSIAEEVTRLMVAMMSYEHLEVGGKLLCQALKEGNLRFVETNTKEGIDYAVFESDYGQIIFTEAELEQFLILPKNDKITLIQMWGLMPGTPLWGTFQATYEMLCGILCDINEQSEKPEHQKLAA